MLPGSTRKSREGWVRGSRKPEGDRAHQGRKPRSEAWLNADLAEGGPSGKGRPPGEAQE